MNMQRPHTMRVVPNMATAHLVARTHDAANFIITLCGERPVGHTRTQAGDRLCGRCRQTLADLTAAAQGLGA
jgi:hypothetical protein